MMSHFELRNSIHDPILHGTFYEPESAGGVVLFIHDMDENRFRYEKLANYYNSRQLVFVSYDLRGHHQSLVDRQKGHFGDDQGASLLLQDVVDVLGLIKERYPNQKILILGNGLGAHLALLTLDYVPDAFDQVVLVNPPSAPKGAKALVNWLSLKTYRSPKKFSDAYYRYLMPIGIEKYDHLTYDQKALECYMKDPFCGRRLTTRAIRDVVSILSNVNEMTFNKGSKDIPVFILGGKGDPLTHYGKDCLKLKKRLIESGYPQVSLHIMESVKHDLLVEFESHPELLDILNKQVYML